MEDAYAAFQADLQAVGGRPGPPPMMPPPMYPPPGGPMPGFMPPPPSHGYYHHPQMHPPMGMPPAPPQPAPGFGTIASIRAGQGLPSSGASGAAGTSTADGEKKKKGGKLREAAGKRWRDPTLEEWPEDDFRIFVGDLGNDVNDDALSKVFAKYPSFVKAKIVKDKRTKKGRGFGFVSFMDPADGVKALKEMQGKYIGNRPVKLRKSTWDERNPSPPPYKKHKPGGAGGSGAGGGNKSQGGHAHKPQ